MNLKIFQLLEKNLKNYFKLPKYEKIIASLNENTIIESLPWTPARYNKFKNQIENELQFNNLNLNGSLLAVTNRLDNMYLGRFFGEIWKPSTDMYQYSGWKIIEEINKEKPAAVLDVGCGYHPFKGRINNLIGIDPYNNCADYMIDILEFKVEPEYFDHIIAFGSLNFNSKQDIEIRFKRLVELLKPGGKIYVRANPGISWTNGPYVDIFPWSFEIVHEFSKTYNLNLVTFKKDSNNRLYFEYLKK
jgi:SAM-dependent methyltransferase